jgi:hypothetical protein
MIARLERHRLNHEQEITLIDLLTVGDINALNLIKVL